eukprot:1835060-Pyramimonas_sp.AAC.1
MLRQGGQVLRLDALLLGEARGLLKFTCNLHTNCSGAKSPSSASLSTLTALGPRRAAWPGQA